MDDAEYAALQARREAKRIRMIREMERAIADTADIDRRTADHPRPWTWRVAFHDHLFFQFIDANGRPCLGNDLTDPDDAAWLLALVNSRV